MLATSPRKRGEVKNGDAEKAHPHIVPTPASASLGRSPLEGRDKKERASLGWTGHCATALSGK